MTEEMEKRVLEAVKDHQMLIEADHGVVRSIVFSTPGQCHAWFRVITWPGCLCISGDYGTFVFNRVDDMFCFFREGEPTGELKTNPYYWAEKLEAVDRADGHDKYSQKLFDQNVKESFDTFFEECDDDILKHKADCWSEIQDDVLRCGDDERSGQEAASDFLHEASGFKLYDFWENSNREYSVRYLWCITAIVWAIRKYDVEKKDEVKDGN